MNKWFAIFLLVLAGAEASAAENIIPACERSEDVRKILQYTFSKPCTQITESELVLQPSLTYKAQFGDTRLSLKHGDFSGMNNVIYLSFFFIDELILGPDTFTELPALQSLSFKYSRIPVLKRNMFAHLVGLTTLRINDSKVREIEPGAFNGLHGLMFLELEKCKIQRLQRGIFVNLPRLQDISFSECEELNEIEDGTFAELPRIHNVTLFQVPLRKTNNSAFRGVTALSLIRDDFNVDRAGDSWGGP